MINCHMYIATSRYKIDSTIIEILKDQIVRTIVPVRKWDKSFEDVIYYTIPSKFKMRPTKDTATVIVHPIVIHDGDNYEVIRVAKYNGSIGKIKRVKFNQVSLSESLKNQLNIAGVHNYTQPSSIKVELEFADGTLKTFNPGELQKTDNTVTDLNQVFAKDRYDREIKPGMLACFTYSGRRPELGYVVKVNTKLVDVKDINGNTRTIQSNNLIGFDPESVDTDIAMILLSK